MICVAARYSCFRNSPATLAAICARPTSTTAKDDAQCEIGTPEKLFCKHVRQSTPSWTTCTWVAKTSSPAPSDILTGILDQWNQPLRNVIGLSIRMDADLSRHGDPRPHCAPRASATLGILLLNQFRDPVSQSEPTPDIVATDITSSASTSCGPSSTIAGTRGWQNQQRPIPLF